MTLPSLFRRSRAEAVPVRREDNPFISLQREMNRMFDQSWRGFDGLGLFDDSFGTFSPRIDIDENENEICVTAELPGFDAKDLDVNVSDDSLVLRGEKREDGKTGWHERSYGRFERVLPLPRGIDTDHVSADYKNGVLTIRMPKSPEARERIKRIQISA